MKVLIIGGIAGGMSVAFKAKRENPDLEITVLEREDYISFGACGLPYYVGNVFDNLDESLFARTIEDAEEKNINLLKRHQVDSVDFDSKQVFALDLEKEEKKVFDYDSLVIATGASPFVPDIEGIESDNVYTLTKPYTAKKLKEKLGDYKNIAIVGGGFIGVEMAEQLSKHHNLNISLYHSRDQVLNNVYDSKAAKAIEDELKKLGVNIHFSERLEDVSAEDGLVKEVISSNRKDQVDALILAIGFKPNTDIFDHKDLNKLDNGAIVIDKYGRTSIKDVWSCGDCASVPHKFLKEAYIPLATSANKMGREIGINLSKKEDDLFSSYESLGTSSVKIGSLEFGSTGLTDSQAEDLGYDYGVADSEIFNKPRYMPESSKISFRIVYEKESFKILGARVYGKNDAVLRLLPYTTAIHSNLTTKDLAYYDYAYSPPFSLSWDPVNISASVAD